MTTSRTQMPDSAGDDLVMPTMGPRGPLRDMEVHEQVAVVTDPGEPVREAAGGWAVPGPVDGAPRAHVVSGTSDVAGALSPVWRTGTVAGLVGLALGLLMIVGTSGLAAVVLWPLGALSLIAGASVLWATYQARRAARRMSVQVRVTRSWQ